MILLENTWEAKDIIDYAKDRNIPCQEITVDELYAMDSEKFIVTTYFCSTDIVQHHLRKLHMMHAVPDCYDSRYRSYFKRTINNVLFSEIDLSKGAIFVKPRANNKLFDGTVYKTLDDFFGNVPSDDTPCYTSDVIDITSEYRLLVGNNKQYGLGHMRGPKMPISEEEVKQYIKASGGDYLCIDLGCTPTNGWIVVEINPPFSLDDYDIDLSSYMNFCIDSCKHIRLHKRFIGINTITTIMGRRTHDLRSEPIVPRSIVSPWGTVSIAPDVHPFI